MVRILIQLSRPNHILTMWGLDRCRQGRGCTTDEVSNLCLGPPLISSLQLFLTWLRKTKCTRWARTHARSGSLLGLWPLDFSSIWNVSLEHT